MSTIKATFKVLLIGDGGVGKTSLIDKARSGKFEKRYIPTMGVEVQPLVMGDVILKVWDTAGQEKFSGLREGYWVKADAVIFVYDGTNHISGKNLGLWMRDVVRLCGEIPFVIVRNKIDASPQKSEKFEGEVEVSCRVGESFLEPFNRVLEKLGTR